MLSLLCFLSSRRFTQLIQPDWASVSRPFLAVVGPLPEWFSNATFSYGLHHYRKLNSSQCDVGPPVRPLDIVKRQRS